LVSSILSSPFHLTLHNVAVPSSHSCEMSFWHVNIGLWPVLSKMDLRCFHVHWGIVRDWTEICGIFNYSVSASLKRNGKAALLFFCRRIECQELMNFIWNC
jgi:hypothetical protein